MYKYTKNWPNKVEFEVLDTPLKVLNFLQSDAKLGIINPVAFLDALENRRLKTALKLYKNIGAKYIEQIALDPTNLYPK